MTIEHSEDGQQIYTPSELTREVRLHIEAGFPRTLLEGEISNLSRPASGHLYFTLKDDKAQVRCALFRSSATRLTIRPENGMKVIARGRISLYEARGDFQMIVDGLRDAGEGLLRQQFEALKKKLLEEGLFDEKHKKTLPPFPLRIGVITSPSGAAIRDVLQVLERRWPLASVRVYAVPVQGEEAPRAIVSALRAAVREAWPELIILCRGGGSLEDLWAFSDESLARAIHDCEIPLVSAVGHETDFSMTDFVADVRAPTPSAAAELVVPDSRSVQERFSRFQRQIARRAEDILRQHWQRLDHISHRLGQRHPRVAMQEQRRRLASAEKPLYLAMMRELGNGQTAAAALSARLFQANPQRQVLQYRSRVGVLYNALGRASGQQLQQGRSELGRLAGTLHAVSPIQTIGRGYAAIFAADGEEVITSVSQIEVADELIAQLADGRARCRVGQITDERIEPD